MKIAILTFQFGCNYGGLLQCYALQQVLGKMGHQVEVLDYYPCGEKSFSFLRGWGLRSGKFRQQAKLRFRAGRMKRNCQRFKERYLKLSPKCDDLKGLAAQAARYDAVIVGSDQVWNRIYHDGPAYFLGWEPGYQGRRISYAASCGSTDQPAAGREQVADWLGRFHGLSVRDQVTFDMAQASCGRSAEIVADPTLLHDFAGVALPEVPSRGSYIFMYTLGDEIEGGHQGVIANIRQRHGNLPVLQVIPTAHKHGVYPAAEHQVYDAGPDQWLALLAGAAFVYTDSFHAAIFAMKQRKPFLAYYSEQIRSARLLDLAQRYQVHCAVACSLADAERRGCFDASPEYAAIEKLIEQQIAVSFDYLAGVLA